MSYTTQKEPNAELMAMMAKTVENAVKGINNLNTMNVITEDELVAAVIVSRIVLDYFEKRRNGIGSLMLSGLILEADHLERILQGRLRDVF